MVIPVLGEANVEVVLGKVFKHKSDFSAERIKDFLLMDLTPKKQQFAIVMLLHQIV